jgi:hypothetical protein
MAGCCKVALMVLVLLAAVATAAPHCINLATTFAVLE